jgi:hypothetical protein
MLTCNRGNLDFSKEQASLLTEDYAKKRAESLETTRARVEKRTKILGDRAKRRDAAMRAKIEEINKEKEEIRVVRMAALKQWLEAKDKEFKDKAAKNRKAMEELRQKKERLLTKNKTQLEADRCRISFKSIKL